MACGLILIANGHKIAQVADALGLARSNLVIQNNRRKEEDKEKETIVTTKKRAPHQASPEEDEAVLSDLKSLIDIYPHIGYRRMTVCINRRREMENLPKINHKRVFRIAYENSLLIRDRRPVIGNSREHKGRVAVDTSDFRWCSDGFEYTCADGVKISVSFVLDCCDREAIAYVAHIGKGYTAEEIQMLILKALENRFDSVDREMHPAIQFLTDNGSCYTADGTHALITEVGLIDCKTPVSSPQSNGIAESFVKTFKLDYLATMEGKTAEEVLLALPGLFARYNFGHAHSALRGKSPIEFRLLRGEQVNLFELENSMYLPAPILKVINHLKEKIPPRLVDGNPTWSVRMNFQST